ncbi:ribose import ATP-binding protein RbsA [Mycolicibacterium murale]|uniref:Ribose import ATP-binding protein RbsA n=1 Tax=Mycolicibacterium murale TaxID=182220 RepID=A0A7I9WR00_9MYCO|nr:sugar ABC transporter ATP-binding protein [Mycolicibacterium murale]MCV7185966.1 sugar ABC transporter ATP-binding protein [Mycolicibacterium murale]GFG60192.1 ribose import ATP-binding protein RbsA [Mycolicibacterium murale]
MTHSVEHRPIDTRTPVTTPRLEMRGITKDFPAGRVLHAVDLTVQPGEVHALVGENGAGKSTLMKILAGVHADHGGTIAVDGEPLSGSSPAAMLKAGIAVIYQEFSLVPDMTAAQNIALGREPAAVLPGLMKHRAARRRSVSELAEIGIDVPADVLVSQLPVGQQQMVEIAKAVARKAKILVMDEPTARLSAGERERLFEIIAMLSGRGVGIIYISHFLEEILAVCSTVTVLRDGRHITTCSRAGLDQDKIAHLMVGDKFEAMTEGVGRGTRAADCAGSPVALALEDVAVAGALAPVTLAVRHGEVMGFAGIQGSGRTELARALVGAVGGTTGRLRVGDYAGLPRNPRHAADAGLLMLPGNRKSEGIIEQRSVHANIALTALRGRFSRRGCVRARHIAREVEDLMGRFAIHPRKTDLQITALSGGNQQKVLFARAVAAQPRVLILDQPTAGVDIGAKAELYAQIEMLADSGVTVLVFSDDLEELLQLSNRIVVMRKGVARDPQPSTQFDRAALLAAITGDAVATDKEI